MPRRTATAPLQLIHDSGALIAAERDDRRMWALHARALQCGLGPIVPAGCVVEAWRASKQRSLARLLDGCEIEPLGADAALRAGAIRRNLPGDVGAIDATVVETAIRRRAAVVTSDRSDIDQLGTAARRRLQIIDI